MKRAATLLLTLALFAAGAASPAVGDKSDPKDPRTERDRVRREKAVAASRLDALKADAKDVEEALDNLDGFVEYQTNLLDDAKAAQTKAGLQVAEAQQRVEDMAVRIGEMDTAVKEAALRAYTSSGSESNLFSTLVSGSPADSLQHDVLYGLVAGDIASALDELAAAQADLQEAKRRADHAVVRAEKHRLKVESKIVDLQDAQAQQEELAVKVDERIDETLAEAAGLAILDASLSKQITARELALAAKVPTARITAKGEVKVPVLPVAPPMPTAVNGLVRVNGITVDASIGQAIAQLVAEAAADGINLSGGGFRSAQAQIDTRRANCGSSNYEIWLKPSSQCRPPAARPGHSMHEKGLAVDFACNGELISNYSHWCYAWISGHAPRVGLRNRGVEAWHWSTNGN